MSKEPSGSMVLDTGVLVEMARGSSRALRLKSRIESEELLPYVGEVNIAELSYLICRKKGWSKASRAAASLRTSGYFRTLAASEFLEGAARLKCERAMSFVDCLTIAMGETLSLPVLFAKHEKELDAEVEKKPFKTLMSYLEDWAV